MDITTIFSIIILILSVVIHEVSHGYAALFLGDTTAKYEGRLTLNPIKHLDPFGSVILPLLLAILPGGLIFGWAKPVPYNPYNLRNRRWGELLVALAGPASNMAVALVLSLVIRLAPVLSLSASFVQLLFVAVLINVLLAIFNLVPIPPLDGSKILFNLFPQFALQMRVFLERWGFVFLLFFIIFLWDFVYPVIFWITHLMTNIG